jgi:uncharacterized RDD family membrane protein YckC
MVDQADLQAFNSKNKLPDSPFRLAPVSDRFLAAGFDFAIFTPVIGLMLAPLFRRLELISLSAPQSTEFSVLSALSVFYICVLVILLQTLFLVWKKATPGQIFFKLQIVDLRDSSKALGLGQCLLRSSLWTLQFFFGLLPFLEVFSEAQRRPLHDRAAGTIVVTRKNQGEASPHPFEAEMVRKIMAMSFLILFFWGLLGVSHLYKMAMRGDFKRSELVAENYLCSEVSDSLSNELAQSDVARLDKAVALYLAGEVEDDCVLAEADFALWSSSDEGNQWAYFAKGIAKKYDKDLAQSYFGKACESETLTAACELAKIQSTLLLMPAADVVHAESLSEETNMTETAQILLASEDFDQARYADAEKKFLALKDNQGFENYSKKGLIKSLWAQGKKEKAEGAFLSTLLQSSAETKEDISAWLCSEQMSEQCSQKSRQSCDLLKEPYLKDLRPVEKPLVALALLKEKDCRQSSDVEMGRFHSVFKDYPDILSYAKALSNEAGLSASERLDLLRDLSFRKSSVRPKALRVQAMQDLAEKSLRKSDIELILGQLDQRKTKDMVWSKISEKLKQRHLDERLPASIQEEK